MTAGALVLHLIRPMNPFASPRHNLPKSLISSAIAITFVFGAFVTPNHLHAASNGPSSAAGDGEPVDLFSFRDPETNALVRTQYVPATKQQLLSFSPSSIRKLDAAPPKGPGFVKSTVQLGRDFPMEWLAFTLAVGMSSAIHTDNSPAAGRAFVEDNTSFIGFASFGGFLAGSRATGAMAKAFGLQYDARLSPRDYKIENIPQYDYINTEKAEVFYKGAPTGPGVHPSRIIETPRLTHYETFNVGRPVGPTRFQKIFSPLVSPMALAGGLLVSNVMHELWADKDLQLCAAARWKEKRDGPKSKDVTAPTSSSDAAKQAQEAELAKLLAAATDAACDKAWETWVEDNKFASYTPEILSMTAAGLIDAFVVKRLGKALIKNGFKAASKKAGIQLANDAVTKQLTVAVIEEGLKAERYLPWVMRGIRVGQFSFGMTPWGRVLSTAGNILLFMEIVHPISPLITKPWNEATKGSELTSRINDVLEEIDRTEKNNWVWIPREDSEFCTGFETDVMGSPTPNMNCAIPVQKKPAVLLKKMAQRQAQWREMLLQEAYLEYSKWQTFVSEFATMYQNATQFYQRTLAYLNYQLLNPRAAKMPGPLHRADVANGIYIDEKKQNSAEGARQAVKRATVFLDSYLKDAQIRQKTLRETETDVLPQILRGLRAMDTKIPLSDFKLFETSFRNLEAMPEDERSAFEGKLRERMFEEGITKLRKVLQDDPFYRDFGYTFGSPYYRELAKTNPFMMLRMLLGNPEPLAPGVSYVRQSNDDENVIVQESKDLHPNHLGGIGTKRMTDYLAVSMVCGPEVDPNFNAQMTDREKLRLYRRRQSDKDFGKAAWNVLQTMFGFQPRLTANDTAVKAAMVEYSEERLGVNESRIHNFSPNAVATIFTSFWASFRPPRVVTADVPTDLCDSYFRNLAGTLNLDTFFDRALLDPYSTEFKIGGESYTGVLDVLRKKARPDIVGTTMYPEKQDDEAKEKAAQTWVNPFQTWWSNRVDVHIVKMVAKFRSTYRQILVDKFIPVLTKTGAGSTVNYNGRVIKLGALEALYDEARLYLVILGKTTKVTKDPAAKKQFSDLSNQVLLEFTNVGKIVTNIKFVEETGSVAHTEFELKLQNLQTRLEELKTLVEARQTAVKATKDVVDMNNQALQNMNGLLGELKSYWGVIRGIQVSPTM